mmetsp:Transcript_14128/g.44089  ORF Transcript_14128/g.44089 Transcript_14128/m.44089 type:complete len:347 (+) Transcript_14128:1064-2104(+)
MLEAGRGPGQEDLEDLQQALRQATPYVNELHQEAVPNERDDASHHCPHHQADEEAPWHHHLVEVPGQGVLRADRLEGPDLEEAGRRLHVRLRGHHPGRGGDVEERVHQHQKRVREQHEGVHLVLPRVAQPRRRVVVGHEEETVHVAQHDPRNGHLRAAGTVSSACIRVENEERVGQDQEDLHCRNDQQDVEYVERGPLHEGGLGNAGVPPVHRGRLREDRAQGDWLGGRAGVPQEVGVSVEVLDHALLVVDVAEHHEGLPRALEFALAPLVEPGLHPLPLLMRHGLQRHVPVGGRGAHVVHQPVVVLGTLVHVDLHLFHELPHGVVHLCPALPVVVAEAHAKHLNF